MRRVLCELDCAASAIPAADVVRFILLRAERMTTTQVESVAEGATAVVDIVLPDQREADALMAFIAGLMGRVRAPQGRTSVHVCSHPAGGAGTYNCRDDPQAQYVEVA